MTAQLCLRFVTIQSNPEHSHYITPTFLPYNIVRSLAHSLRSFIHSFLHSLTRSLAHSFIPWISHSLGLSLIHSFLRSLAHSFIPLFPPSLALSLIHSSLESLTRSVSRSFIHPLNLSLARSLAHSFIHSLTQKPQLVARERSQGYRADTPSVSTANWLWAMAGHCDSAGFPNRHHHVIHPNRSKSPGNTLMDDSGAGLLGGEIYPSLEFGFDKMLYGRRTASQQPGDTARVASRGEMPKWEEMRNP